MQLCPLHRPQRLPWLGLQLLRMPMLRCCPWTHSWRCGSEAGRKLWGSGGASTVTIPLAALHTTLGFQNWEGAGVGGRGWEGGGVDMGPTWPNPPRRSATAAVMTPQRVSTTSTRPGAGGAGGAGGSPGCQGGNGGLRHVELPMSRMPSRSPRTCGAALQQNPCSAGALVWVRQWADGSHCCGLQIRQGRGRSPHLRRWRG